MGALRVGNSLKKSTKRIEVEAEKNFEKLEKFVC